MSKSIIFWVGILCLLVYGGYSIFYDSSPVNDGINYLSSDREQSEIEKEEEGIVSTIANKLATLTILPDSLWEETLVGTWNMVYQEQNSEYIDQIKGEVTYNEDGTFSRIATYTHYGNNGLYDKPYGSNPGIYDGQIIVRSGIKNRGRWKVEGEVWIENISTCSSKRAVNNRHSNHISRRYLNQAPCSFFPKGGTVIFGTRDADYDKYTLTKFQRDVIEVERKNFQTDGTGTYRFYRISD